jgi:hypothetical protein
MKVPVQGTFTCFSASHLDAAYRFAMQSHSAESAGRKEAEAENRSYVLGAVVFAAAFLEATINECFLIAHSELSFGDLCPKGADREGLLSVWSETVEELQVLNKFKLALVVCRRPAFDEGLSPYQPVRSLLKLRNAVVHYKEYWRDFGENTTKLEAELRGKFEPNALTQEHKTLHFFPTHCLSYGCARWAVESARAFADEFYRRMKLAAMYQKSDRIGAIKLPRSSWPERS